MENNNSEQGPRTQENSQGRNADNNTGRQAPMGFEGMNFEQKRGNYGVRSTENNRSNGQEGRNNSNDRQNH